jgi:hypothetical protein
LGRGSRPAGRDNQAIGVETGTSGSNLPSLRPNHPGGCAALPVLRVFRQVAAGCRGKAVEIGSEKEEIAKSAIQQAIA